MRPHYGYAARAVRYGIYGGTFDPFHRGHLEAARAVRRARRLARLFVVPAGRPPHKREPPGAPFEDRLEMARRALRAEPGIEVLDLEGRRPGPSYTVDTVAALRERYGAGERPDLVVGADMLADLPRWKGAGELVRQVTVVAFARPGADRESAGRAFAEAFPGQRPVWVEVPPIDVSASELRRRLAAGEGPEGLLPPEVLAYIREKRLYRSRKGG